MVTEHPRRVRTGRAATTASSRALATLVYALVFAAASAACGPVPPPPTDARPAVSDGVAAPAAFTKQLEFAILEDYDKGDDLDEVERDFRLMRELGVTTWRGSFGWDDYEPDSGRYDFDWLHRFAERAARQGIQLRPYLGYTPEWAAAGRRADGMIWNDPPRRLDDWARFAGAIAGALRRHPNVLSYEIYNEENVPLWWDGTAAEYAAVVARGADAIRAADPEAQVIMGGMVWPDTDWVEAVCAVPGNAARVDVIPFHAYPETWTPDSVTAERYLGPSFTDDFVATADEACGRKPIWINELGFATTKGRTERDQASWWARAIATYAATPRIEHLGIYELKDLRPTSDVIGDPENYHLGLTRVDRTPKLAFHTVRLLVGLLAGEITVAPGDFTLSPAAAGGTRDTLPDAHLFRRPDGAQVLIAWVRHGHPSATVDVVLARAGRSATEYALDGGATAVEGFDGRALRRIRLEPGIPRIFVVAPGT